MTARKFLSLSFLLAAIISSALFFPGVSHSSTSREVYLGRDSDGLTWYLMDYGRDRDGILYAVLRVYYTNETIRAETIDYLTTTCRVPYEDAKYLDFSEYDCEYTDDGIEYALAGTYHCDSQGYEIYSVVYGTRTYEYVLADSFIADGYEYARSESRRTSGTRTRSSSGGCNSGLLSLFVILPLFAFLKKK